MGKCVSLFSGVGGFELPLAEKGIRPVLCVEIDPNARETLSAALRRLGHDAIIADDVTEIDASGIRNDLGLQKGELDLLVGGPPCQSFSVIGKRGSLEDDRGLLLFQMVRFAEVFEPQAVILEQVKGIKSALGPDGKPGGVLRKLTSDFRALGYSTTHKVLRAADYGVPQLRDRLFVVATRRGGFRFPDPTHANRRKLEATSRSLFQDLQPYKSVRDAIADLPSPVRKGEAPPVPNHIDITPDRDRERIAPVPEGEWLSKQHHLPAELRGNLSKKDTTKFRRLAWDKPSLTIRGGEAFYHPEEDRYLTPRECLRLHGFPDEHVLAGPIRGRTGQYKELDQHRLVANAVPPQLVRVLLEALFQQDQLASPMVAAVTSEV